MFDVLNKILRTDSSPVEDLGFIQIDSPSDTHEIANPSYLTQHFISYYLKHRWQVCLVSFPQTLTHYKVIQHKLGNNLEKLSNEGLFKFVSLLNICSSQNPDCSLETATEWGFFQSIILSIKTEITKALSAPSATPRLLVLDGMNTLCDLGVSPSDVLMLVLELRSKHSEKFSSLLTTSLSFDTETSPALSSLTNQLRHWSHLSLSVEELSTGLAKEVDGQMTVRWPRLQAPDLAVSEERYHYKCHDRELRVFAVGASPAVL